MDEFAALGNVIARKFDRDQFPCGDVARDAFSALGIDCVGLCFDNEDVNTSLSSEGIILLQEYRHSHHLERNNIVTEDTRDFVELVRKEEAKRRDVYTRPRLRPEIAQLLDQEDPFKEKLRRMYGIELYQHYGVEPICQDELSILTEARQVLDYDSGLLLSMRRALNSSVLQRRDVAIAERDAAIAERDAAITERDHAIRYPWKYLSKAVRLRFQ